MSGEREPNAVCLQCGRAFYSRFAKYGRTKYCSPACFHDSRRIHWEPSSPRSPKGPRGLTPNTPYLVQKWRREGYTEEEIGEILHRPLSQIREALSVPLSMEQRRTLRKYLTPRRREDG